VTHYRGGADFEREVRAALTIPLTQGYQTTVDAEDYADLLAAGPWQALIDDRTGTVYARRRVRDDDSGRYYGQLMHRYLLPGVEVVDHHNGNGLDNRRANLRPSTVTENNRNRRRRRDNTSGYKGVWTRGARWHARIKADGRERYLGSHPTPESAAHAYDAAARDLHGEFAALNFPQPGERAA